MTRIPIEEKKATIKLIDSKLPPLLEGHPDRNIHGLFKIFEKEKVTGGNSVRVAGVLKAGLKGKRITPENLLLAARKIVNILRKTRLDPESAGYTLQLGFRAKGEEEKRELKKRLKMHETHDKPAASGIKKILTQFVKLKQTNKG